MIIRVCVWNGFKTKNLLSHCDLLAVALSSTLLINSRQLSIHDNRLCKLQREQNQVINAWRASGCFVEPCIRRRERCSDRLTPIRLHSNLTSIYIDNTQGLALLLSMIVSIILCCSLVPALIRIFEWIFKKHEKKIKLTSIRLCKSKKRLILSLSLAL